MAGGAVILSSGASRAELYKGGLNVFMMLVALMVSLQGSLQALAPAWGPPCLGCRQLPRLPIAALLGWT
jgi:hypothetical protein